MCKICIRWYYVLILEISVVSGRVFFFFKQKTAYEMRISDWSSDVCSSDLPPTFRRDNAARRPAAHARRDRRGCPPPPAPPSRHSPSGRGRKADRRPPDGRDCRAPPSFALPAGRPTAPARPPSRRTRSTERRRPAPRPPTPNRQTGVEGKSGSEHVY